MSLPLAKEVGAFYKVGPLLAVALSFMGIYRLDLQLFSIDYGLLIYIFIYKLKQKTLSYFCHVACLATPFI